MNLPASPLPLAGRLPLALTLLAAAALALAVALGVGLYGEAHDADADAAPPDDRLPPVAVLPQAAPPEEPEKPSVEMGGGVVHFYFATGSTGLPEETPLALADVVKGVAAGQLAIIGSFHDVSGAQPQDAALATARAEAVQQALAALGVEADKMELRPPQEAEGSGAEARRVDVWLE
ncbi:MAG: OmpA family protein [Ottowia sp.]|nr:OmpA family protein [Ottowia sp.]